MLYAGASKYLSLCVGGSGVQRRRGWPLGNAASPCCGRDKFSFGLTRHLDIRSRPRSGRLSVWSPERMHFDSNVSFCRQRRINFRMSCSGKKAAIAKKVISAEAKGLQLAAPALPGRGDAAQKSKDRTPGNKSGSV